MGVVYRARQVRLNRAVALKMILAGEHAGAEAAARFLAEAEAVAKLQHPNIVQIFHIDEHDGFPYFEMEYVGGGSLADRLDGTPRPPREAARLVETLAGAMAEAHRQGVVHRDLKPANILLTPDGVPKVADFGLAKLLDVESGLTRTDSVLGSPSYMAPEQAEGKTKDVGPAADIYALGAILYELLTGRPPFRGATVLETLQQVKTAEPVPPSRLVPGLPRDVETIALKCLQKDPGKRYESATALAEDLRRFQAGEPIVARPVGSVERAWRWCRRNPVVAGSLGATAAALVAVAVLATAFAVKQAEARNESNRRLQESRLRVAALDYERGQDACEKGEIGLGLLRLVQSWRSAVAAGDPGTAWQRTARTSLSAWQRHHPKLQAVFSHGASNSRSPVGDPCWFTQFDNCGLTAGLGWAETRAIGGGQDPDPARFRPSSAGLGSSSRRGDADTVPAPQGPTSWSSASALDYDEFANTGLCRAIPRIRAVSNSAIESNRRDAKVLRISSQRWHLVFILSQAAWNKGQHRC